MTKTNEPNFEKGTYNPYLVSPAEVQPGERYGYKIVATIYPGGFWRAYKGGTGWTDKEVLDTGDEITKEVAEKLFPSLAHYTYG